MIGPEVIKAGEHYRVIKRTMGETYLVQQKAGCWRFIQEYKSKAAAIRKMDTLEANANNYRNQR